MNTYNHTRAHLVHMWWLHRSWAFRVPNNLKQNPTCLYSSWGAEGLSAYSLSSLKRSFLTSCTGAVEQTGAVAGRLRMLEENTGLAVLLTFGFSSNGGESGLTTAVDVMQWRMNRAHLFCYRRHFRRSSLINQKALVKQWLQHGSLGADWEQWEVVGDVEADDCWSYVPWVWSKETVWGAVFLNSSAKSTGLATKVGGEVWEKRGGASCRSTLRGLREVLRVCQCSTHSPGWANMSSQWVTSSPMESIWVTSLCLAAEPGAGPRWRRPMNTLPDLWWKFQTFSSSSLPTGALVRIEGGKVSPRRRLVLGLLDSNVQSSLFLALLCVCLWWKHQGDSQLSRNVSDSSTWIITFWCTALLIDGWGGVGDCLHTWHCVQWQCLWNMSNLITNLILELVPLVSSISEVNGRERKTDFSKERDFC